MSKLALPPLSVPLHRRRQTFAVLLTILLIPLCCSVFLLWLYIDTFRPYAVCYFIWTLIDRGPDYAHPRCIPWFRRLVIWRWMVGALNESPTFFRTFVSSISSLIR